MNNQDVDFEEDHSQMVRSIMIDDLGILSTDFHLTAEDMQNLVESGRKGAQLYLETKLVAPTNP